MVSWFSVAAPDAGPKLHPVHLAFGQEALFGPLLDEDTQWLATSSGFITETQIWYATTPTGGQIMCQLIHSSVGVWYPSIQFTFRYVDPAKNVHVWKSTSVTNFVVAPSAKVDRRSCKSDQFTITVDPAHPTKYQIEGKYDDECQISLVFERLTAGWKVGAGPRGGMSYFGSLKDAAPSTSSSAPDLTAGGDGYCIHRFWPRCAVSGIMRLGADVLDVTDSRGMFVNAIQGMRPNVLAASWNFATFQSPASSPDGVALTMMEFTTTPAYGSQKVNIGSVVVGDKLVAVTAGGDGVEGRTSVAEHQNSILDPETGYKAPESIVYEWSGVTLVEGVAQPAAPRTTAKVVLDLLDAGKKTDKDPYPTKGLIGKIDVLGEIPYLVKKFVNYAAGTKPYIYTWLNPAKATITLPADLTSPTGTESRTIEVDGTVFNEATFIS